MTWYYTGLTKFDLLRICWHKYLQFYLKIVLLYFGNSGNKWPTVLLLLLSLLLLFISVHSIIVEMYWKSNRKQWKTGYFKVLMVKSINDQCFMRKLYNIASYPSSFHECLDSSKAMTIYSIIKVPSWNFQQPRFRPSSCSIVKVVIWSNFKYFRKGLVKLVFDFFSCIDRWCVFSKDGSIALP